MRQGTYPSDWNKRRERVLTRDGHRCQKCSTTSGTLQVHHITPISRGGEHGLDNLATVCQSCHAKEHPVQIKLKSALRDHKRIRMKYTSSNGTRTRKLDPYGLEIHQGIQYLVGYDHYRNDIRVFRPKRIKWIEVTPISFEQPVNFDTASYLKQHLRSRRGMRRSLLGRLFDYIRQ